MSEQIKYKQTAIKLVAGYVQYEKIFRGFKSSRRQPT